MTTVGLWPTFAFAGPVPQENSPKPVPILQALPLPLHQVAFQRDGMELARYWFGPELNRPFVYPVMGPSGRSLTRMGHPHDPVGHSHHNSVWISHNSVNGVSFWADRVPGRIVHRRLERLDDGMEAGSILTENAWAVTNQVMLTERRLTTVQALSDKEWLLLIDLELRAEKSAVEFGKTPFGLIGVRLAKSIGVHDGGGTIRNSNGGVNEAGVLWKPARWVDYSGAITAKAVEGITLMDHPINPNHPTVFHVRDDGWMGASLTFDGPRTVETNQPLRLRYGLYVHSGLPKPELLDQRWKSFAELPVPSLALPKE